MKKIALKNIDGRIASLMGGWLINSLGFGAVVPFMTVYFHTVRDLPMRYISLFFLAAAICRTVAQSVGGTLSDYIGRRGLMIWSQFSRSLVFLAAGIAIRTDMSIWVISGILLSQYLLSSFFQPIASAMIADIMPPDRRSNGYALLRMAGNVGWGVGPAIGGFLFDVSYDSLFFFTALMFLISGFVVLFSVRETAATLRQPEPAKPGRERHGFAAMAAAFKQDRIFLFFCLASLMLFLTWGQFVSTLSIFMNKHIGLSSTRIGWIYTFNASLVIVFQYLITQKTRKKNHFVLLMIGTLLFTASYAVMGWMSSFGAMMIIIVFITFGEMFAGPSGNTLASNMARNRQYGRYQGVYSSISTLGWSLGPSIGSMFMEIIPNIKMFWLTMASFGMIAFFGFLILFFKTKERVSK
jgi:MFS family permease